MDIKYYRKCKNIERLQGSYKHRSYNLLEHQYVVAVLFKHFASLEDISYGMPEFDKILHHDILEVETTDLIYTVKNLNEETKKAWNKIEEEVIKEHFQLRNYSDENIKMSLNEYQFKLFKVCDMLDLWIFCKEEMILGNRSINMKLVIDNCEKAILGKFESVDKFMKEYEY